MTDGILPPRQRRAALETLSRDRLADLTVQFGLAVEDRRAQAAHVDALVRARSLDFGELLRQLQRDELKAICGALGLDSAGKEKEPLVRRILDGQNDFTTAPGTNGELLELELPPRGAKLTVEQLESHLWRAADILRGSIDSSDYKGFILGLLFLKRLSDVFVEEAERLITDGTDPKVAWGDRDYHRFFVPKRARWAEVQKQSTGIGDFLNKACSALEEENGSLEGVLRGIDYNDEHKLGNAKHRDDVLSRLVLHFSRLPLRNADLSEPDMLGRAYEYLIEKFADDAGKKGGEFYTPRKVVQLIVELLEPRETDRICDPTCGSGGMLIECAKYVERHRGDPRKLVLHGQEKNLGTWAICKMNMLLHGLPDARIEKGDTIRDPRLVKDGVLEVYDKVIANPPFSLDDWGREVAEADSFGRFRFGIPPRTKGDLAFVQHMVATLNIGGRVGVVMPHGVLFRGGAEGDIRTAMLKEDLFEAVIGLPPSLFYGTGIPGTVLVLSKDKPGERRGKVMFIDASREFLEGKAQSYLRDEDVQKMAGTFHAWKGIEGYARVVSVDEVAQNDWTLNISRYLATPPTAAKTSRALALKNLGQTTAWCALAQGKVDESLRNLGNLGPFGPDPKLPSHWRPAKLGDLLARPLAYGVLKPGPNQPSGVPLVRIQDVHTGRLDPTSMYRISQALHREFRRTELFGGELLFSLVGTLGKVVRVPKALAGANISRALCVISLNAADADTDYVMHVLQGTAVQQWVVQEARGNAQKVLNLGVLRELEVTLPPLAEQRRISSLLTSFDDAVDAEMAKAEALRVVKRTLAEGLLGGATSRKAPMVRGGGTHARST
jgi:type I restriction enzyme M protein